MHQNEAQYSLGMAAGSGPPLRIGHVTSLAAVTRAAHRLSRDLSRGGPAGLVGLASRGLGLALRYPAHRQWLAVIGGQTTRKLLTLYPRIAYRHSTTYLFQGATWQQRMTMLTGHYAFMNWMHGASFFEALLDARGVPVWQQEADGHVLSITLHGPCLASRHREGDLTLAFGMDGTRLYQIAFSVVRDATATLGIARPTGQSDTVLYIGQVQGRAGQLGRMRQAATLCKGVAARDLLMSAAAGLAEAWRLARVVGVCDVRRLWQPPSSEATHRFQYDSFWALYQADIIAGHAVMTLPFHEGPVGGTSSPHRRRARIKRQFKACVSEHVAAVIRAHRAPGPGVIGPDTSCQAGRT